MTFEAFTQQDMGGEVPQQVRRPSLSFVVSGLPKSKGSFTAGISATTQRAFMKPSGSKESRKTLALWQQDVVSAARAAMILRPRVVHDDEAIEVVIEFYLPRPVSAPKRVKYPNRKPDGDKLTRCVWDCLTQAGAIADDARIVRWGGGKHFADAIGPRAEVFIYEL